MDILNLEFPNLDRDRHIITPVYEYLKKKYGVSVISCNLNNRFFSLLRYRPKLLLLSNAHGQAETIEIMKIARASKIKVVTLVTEGNFHEENLHGYLWGWNHEKILNQDAFIFWNEKSKEITLKHHPELKDKIFVSGATGFDRFSLLKFRDKGGFLKEYNLTGYKGVIGIAGFGVFDHLERIDYLKEMQPAITDEQIQMHKSDLENLREIYLHLIQSNPDILFIVRHHPQITDTSKTEFTQVEHLPNVIVSNNYKTSEYGLNNITDVISVCDLWLGYESTTVVEAWMLKKPTILVNPTTDNFTRENHSSACPKVKTVAQLNEVIKEYYLTGRIGIFEALNDRRKAVIRDIIGYADGKNHQRAAGIIMKFLENQRRPSRLDIFRNLPFRFALKTTLRFYLFNTLLYKRIRPNVWASHYWYPLDKKEVAKYEMLYKSVV